MVAHPVTQVIGEQALVDILDLSEVAWTCWGVSTPRSGLGLRMVKELDLQLALGMNERRKTGSLHVYDIMHRWGCWRFESRTDPKLNLSVQLC